MSRNESLERLITLALEEDVGPGDWTTAWTVPRNREGRATVVAKEALVVAGTGPAVEVFRRVDPQVEVSVLAPDGSDATEGMEVMTAEGPLRSILTAERVALNFLGRLSGIATMTRRFVKAVSGTGTQILDTRKTTPGWRTLEKAAVTAGGGRNHRVGLFDMILVKENHIAAAGGIRGAVDGVRRANRDGLPVEVEVTSLEELEEVMMLGIKRILLDNMRLETMRAAVKRARSLGRSRPLLEASGNMTLGRVKAVAETGVDFISIGAITHSAPCADLSLRVLE